MLISRFSGTTDVLGKRSCQQAQGWDLCWRCGAGERSPGAASAPLLTEHNHTCSSAFPRPVHAWEIVSTAEIQINRKFSSTSGIPVRDSVYWCLCEHVVASHRWNMRCLLLRDKDSLQYTIHYKTVLGQWEQMSQNKTFYLSATPQSIKPQLKKLCITPCKEPVCLMDGLYELSPAFVNDL